LAKNRNQRDNKPPRRDFSPMGPQSSNRRNDRRIQCHEKGVRQPTALADAIGHFYVELILLKDRSLVPFDVAGIQNLKRGVIPEIFIKLRRQVSLKRFRHIFSSEATAGKAQDLNWASLVVGFSFSPRPEAYFSQMIV
jgi:hypothetical protein